MTEKEKELMAEITRLKQENKRLHKYIDMFESYYEISKESLGNHTISSQGNTNGFIR
jgi:hypothetical protein